MSPKPPHMGTGLQYSSKQVPEAETKLKVCVRKVAASASPTLLLLIFPMMRKKEQTAWSSHQWPLRRDALNPCKKRSLKSRTNCQSPPRRAMEGFRQDAGQTNRRGGLPRKRKLRENLRVRSRRRN